MANHCGDKIFFAVSAVRGLEIEMRFLDEVKTIIRAHGYVIGEPPLSARRVVLRERCRAEDFRR